MKNDLSRLDEFRTIRSEIRGYSKHMVVGIDIAKERHHAFFGTPAGKTLSKKFVFRNDREGFEQLRSLAQDLKNQNGLEHIVYALEPTGVYHKPLLEYLTKEEEMAVLVSNVAVKRNRELLDWRWDKNDVNDPANVANLAGQGLCFLQRMQMSFTRQSAASLRACASRLCGSQCKSSGSILLQQASQGA